ncbi:MAG: glycosyltransferase [Caulobacteraceae bacterium]
MATASVAASRWRSRPDKNLGPEEWVARRLDRVMLAIGNGDKAEVRALIDEIIEWTPDAATPIELAAEFAARTGDWAGLVRYRAALTAARPGDRAAKIGLIRALALAKATSAALDMVDRLLEGAPVGGGFRRLRLEILLAAGDQEAVARQCQELARSPGGESVEFMTDVAEILAGYEAFGLARDWVARARAAHGDTPALTRLAATLDERLFPSGDAERADSAFMAGRALQNSRFQEQLGAEASVGRRLDRVIAAIREGGADDVRAMVDEIIEQAPEATAPIELAAEFAARNEDWPNLVHYRRALSEAKPGDRSAKVALARAMARGGPPGAAVEFVTALLDAEPIGAGWRRLRLELLVAEGAREAVATASAALMHKPADQSAAFVSDVAQILFQGGDYERAAEWVRYGQARHPGDSALARLAATIAYRERRWNEADRLWRELEASADESGRRSARVFRARIAAGDGRPADAAAQYGAVFNDDNANEEAARHLVRHGLAEGKVEEAASVLARHEGRVGRTALVIGLRARLALARGDRATALAEYRQGLADHPADVDLRRDLADLHGSLGDYEAMDLVLADAEALAPRDPAILSRRLTAGIARQLPPDQMLAVADRLLALRPADQATLRQKANLLIRLGERREAVTVLLETIELNPANVAAWTGAMSNLLILNEAGRAATLVNRARATFQGETTGDLIAMAEILESADRGDEAVDHAERAVADDPQSGAARLVAARLWESRGLYRRAWPHLLALQDLEASHARAALTFARVARALHYVDAHPVAGAENDRFPDAIFDRMSRVAIRRRFDEAEPLALHVTSSLAAGGSERQVALTVRGLAAAPEALHPELVVQDPNPLAGRDFFLSAVRASGVPVSTLVDMRGEGAVRELMATSTGRRAEISLLSALPTEVANVALPLYTLIVQRRPRVVHLWQDAIVVAGGAAAMLAGVPHIVLSTRSTRPIERQRARPYLMAGYHALLRYPGTTMLNNSLNGARDYADWLGIEPGRIQTLHNGFVFDELAARADPELTARVRRELGAGPDDVVIGGVMRCSFEKRPELWLETVIHLAESDPRIRGVLVGEGPMRAELRARVEAAGLGDRIRLVGRQIPVEPWMNAMDILFLSSVTEGLPNVLIEAQALGVAVATMRVGGAPETVLENETALVIDEGPVDRIAGAMTALTRDAGRRERFGAAGVKWTATAFSLDAAVARLGEIYAES